MRGRKPKPTARKVLEGNPGKRPLNAAEPQHPAPEAEAFDAPPDELRDHARASAEWRRLAPLLRQARAVTDADRAALLALCLEWDRYLEATQKIRVHGLVVKTPSGYPMPNPFIAIATKALAGCTKLWPELGLTPSSRTRVKTDAALPTDAWSEFDEAPPQATRH
jgi:P27 family predicted phage terminase small subunit